MNQSEFKHNIEIKLMSGEAVTYYIIDEDFYLRMTDFLYVNSSVERRFLFYKVRLALDGLKNTVKFLIYGFDMFGETEHFLLSESCSFEKNIFEMIERFSGIRVSRHIYYAATEKEILSRYMMFLNNLDFFKEHMFSLIDKFDRDTKLIEDEYPELCF